MWSQEFGDKIKKRRRDEVDAFFHLSSHHSEVRTQSMVRHYNPLKPIEKVDMKIGAFDIETRMWVDEKGYLHDARDLSDPDKAFSFGSCMWLDKKGVVHEKVFFDRKEMATFMISSRFRHYHWWGFASGRFDLIGLYHEEVLNEEKFRVLYRNGSIIQLTYLGQPSIRNGKVSYSNKIYFNDLRLITGRKLSDIGHALGLDKLHSDKRNEGGFGEITDEDVQYNLRDTEIVLRFVMQMANLLYDKFQTKMKFTIASIASSVFRTCYLRDTYPEGFRVNDVDRLFRESYYGGRVELYDRREEYLNVIGFDVNSLYPYVMRKYEYPDPSSLRYYYKLPDGWEKMLGMVRCTVYVPEELKDSYPVLPYKTKEGKLIFPVGIFSGSWNVPELVYAMKFGVRILDVKYAVLTSKKVRPFKRFVDDLYKMRKEYKAQGNKVYEFIIKIILNSSYGKFAQRIKHEEFGRVVDKEKLRRKGRWFVITDDPASDYGIWVELNEMGEPIEEDSPQDVISWASTITSYARIELHKRIMEAVRKGYKVIYSDTDSLFIEETDSNAENALEVGNDLGMVKIEHRGLAIFYAPKIYKVKEKEGWIYKHKGVSDSFNWAEDAVYIHRGEKVARPDREDEKYDKFGRSVHHGFSWDDFRGSFVKLCNLSDLVRTHKPLGSIMVIDRHLTGRDEKRDWNGSHGYAKVIYEDDMKGV